MSSLKNKKILIFVDDHYEDMELWVPKYRLLEEGCQVIFAGAREKYAYKSKHDYPAETQLSFDQVKVEDFAGLIVPGGYAPDKLRRYPKVLEITKKFHEQGKLIAFICHAGWVLISSQVLRGVTCTSVGAIKDDIVNAGGKWVDEPVVIDGHFISSRTPEDLPKFCAEIVNWLGQG